MDDIDRIQKRLSGICDKCDYPLTEHKRRLCPVKFHYTNHYTQLNLWDPYYFDEYDEEEESDDFGLVDQALSDYLGTLGVVIYGDT